MHRKIPSPVQRCQKKSTAHFFPPSRPMAPQLPPRGKKLQLFSFPFFPRSWGWEPGKKGVEKRCWGEKSPSGEKLRNLWRGKKGEGERETSVAGKEAGAAFIITGLDTTFSREGKGRDLTAFPTPFVARTNFSPPSEFSSFLPSPLSPRTP